MKQFTVLGLETSGEVCRVARLIVPGKPGTVSAILGSAAATEGEYSGDASRHSEMLWTLLDQVLSGCGVTAGSISLIAVSIGPGSFTGLRVGLAAAKVFAQFGGIPLVGVPTLEAAAEEVSLRAGAQDVLAALDARRGEVYACRFSRAGKFLRARDGIRICTIDEARRGLSADVPAALEPPRASTVAALGLARFLAGRQDDPRTLVPVYVRRPEAVERRMKAGKSRR